MKAGFETELKFYLHIPLAQLLALVLYHRLRILWRILTCRIVLVSIPICAWNKMLGRFQLLGYVEAECILISSGAAAFKKPLLHTKFRWAESWVARSPPGYHQGWELVGLPAPGC